MIFRRSAAKFRRLALDEAPMEVIRMKAFVCLCVCVRVCERERERKREWVGGWGGGANKQLMAYKLGARERERMGAQTNSRMA